MARENYIVMHLIASVTCFSARSQSMEDDGSGNIHGLTLLTADTPLNVETIRRVDSAGVGRLCLRISVG